MTTQIEGQYIFKAKVKGLAQQQNSDGWMLTLDWKLPGSRYDLNLYGQDWADVDGLVIGNEDLFTINRGNLKSDKDGRYATHYFWDLVPYGTDLASDAPEPRRIEPARTHQEGHTGPSPVDVEGMDRKGGWNYGMAFNNACLLVAELGLGIAGGATLTEDIRLLRDQLYNEVLLHPIAKPHFCYVHETERVQSQKTGHWGHVLDDGTPCVEETADGEEVF